MDRRFVAKSVVLISSIAAAILFAAELWRPSLLLVGNVTVDLVDGKKALGGAVAYAAAVASALRIKAYVVTAGGEDADLSAFKGHKVHFVKTAETLTFEHSYTWWGHRRKLKVTKQPDVVLTAEHVPRLWRRARVVVLGPLTPQDMDCSSFLNMYTEERLDRFTGFRQQIGLFAQGLQRGLDAGKVIPYKMPSPSLIAALGPTVSVFLSDVETDPWPQGTIKAMASKSARWLVTRGDQGAHEFSPEGNVTHLPAVKTSAVDTNGAGDTFGTAYMMALAVQDERPGHTANWAASRAVLKPQSCKPHCVSDSIRDDMPWGRFMGWLRAHSAAALSAAHMAVHTHITGSVALSNATKTQTAAVPVSPPFFTTGAWQSASDAVRQIWQQWRPLAENAKK